MARGSFEWEILRDSATAPGWHFVDTLEKRFERIKRMLVYIAAQELLTNVRHKIPKTDEYKEIQKTLSISEVTATREPTFSIHSSVKSHKVRKIDQERTVLYVRAKRGTLNPASAGVKFLEDNGPWTTDTIPYWPSKKQAVVIQRVVSKSEAAKISQMQQRNKSKTDTALQKIGMQISRHKDDLASKKMRRGSVVSDASFMMLRLEFGAPGTKPNPVWRVGISDLQKTGIKSAPKRYKELQRAFANPFSTEWKRWPRVESKIKAKDIRAFVPFMKRLGVV